MYELGEDIELLAEFPRPTPQGRSEDDWVAPDLSFAVFQDETSYTAVHRDGSRMWQQPSGAWSTSRRGHVGFAMAGPYRETQVLLRLPSGTVGKSLFAALDSTGKVLARTSFPAVGRSGTWGWPGDPTAI
ncbi:hypothetical protein ACFW81_10040 [Streptomyces angustmyceticus]|uniref:hypothetical protein n=1 Tax=Streptomyces angustmyceticus TaxID=285578 RepID=UPI0036829452